jgi:hypothetical protein
MIPRRLPSSHGNLDALASQQLRTPLDAAVLGVREFPVTPAGYAGLLGWLCGFGAVALVGIEGTGSYGAGLARHVTAAGIRVVEVDRSDRQDRRGRGSPGTRSPPWSASWQRCGPGPAARSATPPASRCGSWGGADSAESTTMPQRPLRSEIT